MVLRTLILAIFVLFAAAISGAEAQPACAPGTACWTTSTRPVSPRPGQFGFNTTLGAFEYWNSSAWFLINSLNLNAGLTSGFNVTENATGSSGANIDLNSVTVTDDAAANLIYFHSTGSIGGSNVTGSRSAIQGDITLNHASSASNTDHTYVGVTGEAVALVADGGTNLGAGAKGAVFGMVQAALLLGTATNYVALEGTEILIGLGSGASARYKWGVNVVPGAVDQTHASVYEAAFGASANVGALGLNWGLLFHDGNGQQPFATSATIIGVTATSVAKGVDFTAATFSGNAFGSPGFSVNGSGDITGRKAVLADANSNLIIGSGAAAAVSTAVFNIAIGINALAADASGNFNVCIGVNACLNVSSGGSNVALGINALLGSAGAPGTGNGNFALGASSLLSCQGACAANIAIGVQAGQMITTSINNLLLGSLVGSTTLATGSRNILLGTDSNCDTAASNTSDVFLVCASGGATPLLQGNRASGSLALTVNGLLTTNAATMIGSNTSYTDGAAASLGTLTNAPAAGNPTKWIPVNDNGTTRYIPAW